MSKKLKIIPDYFNTYKDVRKEMDNDFQYRFENRTIKTPFGIPLYYRINVQMVITNACPYNCSFCLERQNPQGAVQNFDKQIQSLKKVLVHHPNARITITGGEPALYQKHVKKIIELAKPSATFIGINTTDYKSFSDFDVHINVSDNMEIHSDLSLFENKDNVTLQTIFKDTDMTMQNIKKYMELHNRHNRFSFRYLTDMNKSSYDVSVLEELRNESQATVTTFRIGDFFMYIIGSYNKQHFRITLGDMNLQQSRYYKGTYSNIVINPEGNILLNWNNSK